MCLIMLLKALSWKLSNFIRHMKSGYFVDHPVKIGGPCIEVEIDESCRKYNCGR